MIAIALTAILCVVTYFTILATGLIIGMDLELVGEIAFKLSLLPIMVLITYAMADAIIVKKREMYGP